jgi:hypothetical protein
MFKRRTLFIVGAGASSEVGLPVGTQLARTIAEKLNVQMDIGRVSSAGDPELFLQFRRVYRNEFNEYISAAHLIRDGIKLSSSIDDFLDIHSADLRVKRVGKAAIVRAILEAEKASKLYVDPSNIYNKIDYNQIEGTWYVKFIKMLGRGQSLASVQKIFDNVAFVVFNYDRCIEHFLSNALQQLYGLDRQDAIAITDQLNIIHPYGTVGQLATGVPFGGDPHNSLDYLALSDRVKTYTEQVAEGDTISTIHDEVIRSEQIVFLGFAYHDQNMTLIKPDQPLDRKPFFGTALGMSESDRQVVIDQMLGFVAEPQRNVAFRNNSIAINNIIRCSELLDYYGKSLVA